MSKVLVIELPDTGEQVDDFSTAMRAVQDAIGSRLSGAPAPEWGEPWAGRAYTNIGAYWRGMRSFRRWARQRLKAAGQPGPEEAS